MTEREILIAAFKKASAAERSAYLDEACGDDRELRQRVETLLAEHEKQDGFTAEHEKEDGFTSDAPTPDGGATLDHQSISEQPGTVIGRYKLLEQIGEGGFGVVFMAEQREPIRRKVALKIIKPGMDTREVIARFEAERQALALMDHPNIARALDAGATESGRPYFVMELVRGIPITDYCDQNNLTTGRRLELFSSVCQAVQHAHQKGIIHRDIKPTNVMVTSHDGEPVAKVIDFGVAKAIHQRLTEKTLFTGFAQMIGTPLYMSPEQAQMSGLDVDTRSDIYSLGVLLYELLTGTTPLDKERISRVAYDELLRIIREEEPPKPSTRISGLGQTGASVAAQRKTEFKKLSVLVRGDLDWIVMKALEKDRTRRYETASSLADDVRRFLRDEPIEARPPSTVYRVRKFVRRNKPAILSAALISIALLVGTVLSAWQAVRATRAEREASGERDRAVSAEQRARVEERRTQVALVDSQRSAAELALDKGQLLGRQGDINLGLLWMARSLELAPPEATELRRVIRTNLGGWRRRTSRLRLMLPHEGRVDAVAFSPDGATLLTAAKLENQGVVLRRWNTQTGRPIGQPFHHLSGMVSCVAFSPDAGALAVGYAKRGVELIDVATGEVTDVPIPTDSRAAPSTVFSISTAVFNPEGTTLLIAGGQRPVEDFDVEGAEYTFDGFPGVVHLVDLTAAEPVLAQPMPHPRLVWTAAFSPDGKTFVTESGDWGDMQNKGIARIWNLNGEQILEPVEHPGTAAGIALSPDGKQLLTGHFDFKARRWDLATGELTLTLPCDGPVASVAFGRDATAGSIVTGSFGGTVQLWDAGTGEPLGPPLLHRNLVRCLVLSPDGGSLLTGARGTARLWELNATAQDRPILPFAPLLFPLSFSQDRQTILTKDGDEMVRLRDAKTGRSIGKPIPHPSPILTGAFSPDRKYAATIGMDHLAHVWDLSSGEPIVDLKHRHPASAVAFSRDGKSVATANWGCQGVLWDTATGRQTGVLEHQPHTGPVLAVTYSPDGRTILTGGADRFARLWDAASGKEMARKFRHNNGVIAVAFSPDGTKVVTGGTDRAAQLWEVATGETLGPPLRHQGTVFAAAFSLDGRTVLTGGMDQTARLWDVATGKQLGPSLQHSDRVVRVGFWADGKTLLTSEGKIDTTNSELSVARYWRIPTAVAGDHAQIELWVEVITGSELEADGGVRVLDAATWRSRRQRLQESGWLAPRWE